MIERDDLYAEPRIRILLIIKEKYDLILFLRLGKWIIATANTLHFYSISLFMKLFSSTNLVHILALKVGTTTVFQILFV